MRQIPFNRCWLPALLVLAVACGEGQNPAAPKTTIPNAPARPTIQAFECVASVRSASVSCAVPGVTGGNRTIYGGQGTYVQLTSSNVSYADSIYQFDVTVKNLLVESIGTPDSLVVDTAGIKVFFASGPTVDAGSGSVSVDNEDGEKVFTGTTPQPFFRYTQKLAKNEVTPAKTWRFKVDPSVEHFVFTLYVEATIVPLLVINQLMANPAEPISDAAGEWFEVYNRGSFPFNMKGMLIADSSASSGRAAYHVIASNLTVAGGGYVVLGNTRDTLLNGGVTEDYAYGSALSFANSIDAIKIAWVYQGDTLTIDRAAYASTTSAKSGISRELKNPASDNADIDGVNWGDALATARYGPGGFGTPKEQNSIYTP